MGEIVYLEQSRSRINTYAENYIKIIQNQKGWLAGGQYLAKHVPKQLRHQVQQEVEKLQRDYS